jgi:transcriptional regulator with XRE-family HTH domain
VGDVRAAFGQRVRELRTKRGLSQEQLAARADLHWTYVSSIERGRRDPGLRTVVRIAVALGVTASDLMRDLTPPPKSGTRKG